MKLPYQVQTKHGSVLAAFAHESDARGYAEHRAATTFQTPTAVFRVVSMTKTTKAPNGRLIGELWGEYESRPNADWKAP
jgi:hypothetical protein